MSSPFEVALAFLFEPGIEGGYSNNPKDPGKETNYGITAATLAFARRGMPGLPESVRDLTRDHAAQIYFKLYWLAAHCDQLPPGVSAFVFDSAVQHDPVDAIKFLQAALLVTDDGYFGPVTANAVKKAKGWKAIVREMAARRAWHYMKLDSIDDTFGLGWARRLLRIYDLAREAAP